MATTYERAPMSANAVIGLILAIIAMLAFGAYTAEYLIGVSRM